MSDTIPLDPAETFPVTLDRHEHIPEADRPTWRFRFLTRRQSRELRRIWDAFDAVKELPPKARDAGTDDVLDTLEAFLLDKLAGWQNQPAGPFDPARFDETVLETDLMTIMVKVRAYNRLGPTLLGRFESLARTPSAASAANTAGEPDVPTPPAQPSPQKSSVPSATVSQPTGPTKTASPPPALSVREPDAS